MGIVKMNRLTLVGLARERASILTALSKLGAVEVRENPEISREYSELQMEERARLQRMQADRQLLESLIPEAKDLLPHKKPMFTLKRSISMKDFLRYDEEAYRLNILRMAEHLRENRKALQEAQAKRAALLLQQDVLAPWSEALQDADPSHSRRIHRWLGRLSNHAQFAQLENHLQEHFPTAVLSVLKATDPKEPVLALLAAPASQGEIPLQEAQGKGFKPLQQKHRRLTPRQEYEQVVERLAEVDAHIEQLGKQAVDLAQHVAAYEELSDYLQVEIEKLEAQSLIPVTGRLFALEGYIPEHLAKGTQRGLEETYCVSIQMRPADRVVDYPILLQNNRLVRPYEAITDMFSLPQASEVDPVPSVMPFYCLFFGMMFSDVAYGIIFCILTGFLVWKVKVQGNFRKMCQVFFQCGLSSIVWGVLFGSYFGNLIGEFTNHAFVPPALWFDPLKDPTRLMLWSVVFGTIHLFVGLGVKMKICFATGRWQEAIFDVAPWYFIISGLGLLGGGAATGNPLFSLIGKIFAIGGAVVILLMAGRPSKNPIKRIFKGLGSLYGVTGYFSDIMSYTRILALALSTAVIAMVVNLLALLPGKSVLGLIFFVAVALVGHTMNFALSALSAYVHTTRLHYVEYFGKFLEGGGRAFAPLAYHTKYVLIDRPADPTPVTESLRKRFKRFSLAQE